METRERGVGPGGQDPMKAEIQHLYNLHQKLIMERSQFREKDFKLAWRLSLEQVQLEGQELKSFLEETQHKPFTIQLPEVNAQPTATVSIYEKGNFAFLKNFRGKTLMKSPIINIPQVTPIPKYTIWAPMQRNFQQIQDSEANKNEGHIPYFSEETFDRDKGFIKMLERDWENGISKRHVDPVDDDLFYNLVMSLMNSEIIQIAETAKKPNPGVSCKEGAGVERPAKSICDKMKMSPDMICRMISDTFENAGSPVQLRNRFTQLHSLKSKQPNTTHAANIDGVLQLEQHRNKTMDTYHRTFCRRCFVFNCRLHLDSVEHVFPEYQKKLSPFLVTNGPCSATCYLIQNEYSLPNIDGSLRGKMLCSNSDWSPGDASMFSALVNPYLGNFCVIGNIMQKPCKLVQKYASTEGRHILEDAYTCVGTQAFGASVRTKKKIMPIKRARPTRYISATARYTPCFHPGTKCNLGNEDCSCSIGNTYCEKFCTCDDCKNRFPGCWCKTSCESGICPCYAASRECDPDLCLNCGGGKDDESTCRNVHLQKGIHKHLRLGVSTIQGAGWGIFATTKIFKNEFIYEYAGEIISYEEADRRAVAYDKRSHTYLFQLNDCFMIDAMRKGNKMRFANHSDNPNCIVRLKMVKGDHHIAVFAQCNINPGEELFIYYKEVLKIHQEEKERAMQGGKSRARKSCKTSDSNSKD